jgi:uncharacterized protein YcbK (DUF882 family)
MSLQSYLTEHDIKHFSALEINPVGKLANGKGPALKEAPKDLWPNIIYTLKVVEWLRSQWGESIHVLSGYRDKAYNKAVGGEGDSTHMAFMALDIRMPTRTPKEIAQRLEKHPDAKLLGIGTYRTFVHVDCRGLPKSDSVVAWRQRNPGKWPQARWNG